MRGFQSNASEVRSALERLSDAGIVERVRLAPVGKEARRQEGNVVKLDRKVVVIVTVAGRSPEKTGMSRDRIAEHVGAGRPFERTPPTLVRRSLRAQDAAMTRRRDARRHMVTATPAPSAIAAAPPPAPNGHSGRPGSRTPRAAGPDPPERRVKPTSVSDGATFASVDIARS